MGVKVVYLNDGWREQYGYRGAGVLVTDVEPMSPADRIGVVAGDILVAIGATSLRFEEDLATAHANMDPTQQVPVVIARHHGSMMKIRNLDPIPVPEVLPAPASATPAASIETPQPSAEAASAATSGAQALTGNAATQAPQVEAVEAPSAANESATHPAVTTEESAVVVGATAGAASRAPAPASKASEPDQDPLASFGVQGANLNRDLAAALGVSKDEGVLVLQVTAGGPADRVGIRSGDVISAAGTQPVANVETLSRALRSAVSGITLHTWRRGDERDIGVSLATPPVPATGAASEGSQEAAMREELQSLRQEIEALRAEMQATSKNVH